MKIRGRFLLTRQLCGAVKKYYTANVITRTLEKKSLVTDATGNDLTCRIIGTAIAVHNEIGYGFKEEAYEKALNEVHKCFCISRDSCMPKRFRMVSIIRFNKTL